MNIDISKLNRIEVINYVNPKEYAREYVYYLPEGADFEFDLQDGVKTLKIFVQKRKEIKEIVEEKKLGEGICTGNIYDCHFVPWGGKWSPINRMRCETCGQIND